jgi:hypothetical protein
MLSKPGQEPAMVIVAKYAMDKQMVGLVLPMILVIMMMYG